MASVILDTATFARALREKSDPSGEQAESIFATCAAHDRQRERTS